VKVGKHKKKRLDVVVTYADTGAKKTEFPSPFQKPAFSKVQVSVKDTNGDGAPDTVVLTGTRRHKSVTMALPG
jgi:hypothetical protein